MQHRQKGDGADQHRKLSLNFGVQIEHHKSSVLKYDGTFCF